MAIHTRARSFVHAAIAAPLVELRWSAVERHCCTTDRRWLFSRAAAGSPIQACSQYAKGGTTFSSVRLCYYLPATRSLSLSCLLTVLSSEREQESASLPSSLLELCSTGERPPRAEKEAAGGEGKGRGKKRAYRRSRFGESLP